MMASQKQEKQASLISAIVLFAVTVIIVISTRSLLGWFHVDNWKSVAENTTALLMGVQLAVVICRWRDWHDETDLH